MAHQTSLHLKLYSKYGKTSDKIVNNTFIQPRDDAESLYSYHRNTDDSTIAVYPSFTRTAYSPGGLANHYLADVKTVSHLK